MAKGRVEQDDLIREDPQQAAVNAAVDALNERMLDANERRGDTRKADRAAALKHQQTVDEAVARAGRALDKANAEVATDRAKAKAREDALAHQKRVDDAVAELNYGALPGGWKELAPHG